MGEDDPVRLHVEPARHQTGWRAEDEAMIILRYPHDRMAMVCLSYNQPYVLDRKTLHFERALVRIEDGKNLWVNDHLAVGSPNPDPGRRAMGARDLSPYFEKQFEEFVKAVRGLPNRSVLHHDAFRLIDLMERILSAAITSRESLPVP